FCVAVVVQRSARAERWDGRRWWTMRFSKGAAAVLSLEPGVACVSSRACEAVGHACLDVCPKPVPWADGWNGRTWSAQPTQPPGVAIDRFTALSCSSTDASTATGPGETGADSPPLPAVERRAGDNGVAPAVAHPG